jgi:hypothetical protein
VFGYGPPLRLLGFTLILRGAFRSGSAGLTKPGKQPAAGVPWIDWYQRRLVSEPVRGDVDGGASTNRRACSPDWGFQIGFTPAGSGSQRT